MDIIDRAMELRLHITEMQGEELQTWEQFEAMCKEKKLFLFGAGPACSCFVSNYHARLKLEGVIDNSKGKQGYCLGDLVVEAVDTAYEEIVISDISILKKYRLDDIVILITSTNYYRQIMEQLGGMGIRYCFVQLIMEAKRRKVENYKSQCLISDKNAKAEYAERCCKQNINPQKIVFYSFGTYSDHGKYISEALLNIRRDLDIVWLLNDVTVEVPKGVRKVYMGNWKRYIYEMETAKVWIYNMIIPDYLIKRNEQIYVQTKHWAGVTLKKFYLDASTIQKEPKKTEIWKFNSRIIDYIITGSEFDTESCRRGFEFSRDAIQVGSPRSDALFNRDALKKKVCNYYHMDKKVNTILYAPTYRFGKQGTTYLHETREIALDFGEVKKALEQCFGGIWYIVLRLHPSVAKDSAKIKKPDFVIDASGYEDSEELVAACDAMISDYSSIMFEPAFVKKPVFLFATDRKEYIDKEYDLLIDYDTLPFSIAESNAELIQNIKCFSQSEYEEKVDYFLEKYGVCEDGHASERAAIFISRLIDQEVK